MIELNFFDSAGQVQIGTSNFGFERWKNLRVLRDEDRLRCDLKTSCFFFVFLFFFFLFRGPPDTQQIGSAVVVHLSRVQRCIKMFKESCRNSVIFQRSVNGQKTPQWRKNRETQDAKKSALGPGGAHAAPRSGAPPGPRAWVDFLAF